MHPCNAVNRVCDSLAARVRDGLGGSFRTPSVSEGPLTDAHKQVKGRPDQNEAISQAIRSLTVAVLKSRSASPPAVSRTPVNLPLPPAPAKGYDDA